MFNCLPLFYLAQPQTRQQARAQRACSPAFSVTKMYERMHKHDAIFCGYNDMHER